MSKNSDNNSKPRTNIFDFLPEVYRSDLNETLIETSFNRHLTKDDTVRVSGYVGQGNPGALVNRQLQEPTPHRQAYQLQPIMYSRVGTTDRVLTQQGFLKRLELLGVDINRLPKWANTLQFNWVPPINIDMLTNYFDYYWPSVDPEDLPQYLTIENRCNRARSKAVSYENVLQQRGELHEILALSVTLNTFTIAGDLSDLFVDGFVFYTKNTADVNLSNKFWTAASSVYDSGDDETTITTQENIAIVSLDSLPDPISTEVGRWWYAPDSNTLYEWTGATWFAIPFAAALPDGDISLSELLTIFRRDANCVCNEDYGWDLGLWDDNQLGPVLWNTALLIAISHPTEAAWIVANGVPANLDLWYDTTADQLKQYYGITPGYQNVTVAPITSGGNITALPANTYDFDITIDGGPLQQLSITTAGGETYNALAALMSAQVTGGTVTYSNPLSAFVFTSSSTGTSSTVLVAAGTAGSAGGDFFAAITLADTLFLTFNASVVGTAGWTVIFNSFSTILTLTTGDTLWDKTEGCVAQELNQWSEQNKWIHKTEIQSFSGVKRAQIPILEYNSTIEMAEWAYNDLAWKYRVDVADTFETSDTNPWRFELEPIKGYAAVLNTGVWYVYVFDADTSTMNRDINHTEAFQPGTAIKFVDDLILNQVYTVARSEYRKIEALDPVNAVLAANLRAPITDYYVTVIQIQEAVFTAPVVNNIALNTRIEPTLSSKGDVWRGYHAHWVLDPTGSVLTPTSSQAMNPVLVESLAASEAGSNPSYSVTGVADGILEVGTAHIIFTTGVAGVTTISLDMADYVPVPTEPGFIYDPAVSHFYATPGSNELRVYVDDIRQYGTYTENVATGAPSYTGVGFVTTTTPSITYVESITFTEPLDQFAVVRIEVAPASVADMGRYAVPVRTIENEAAFTAAVALGTQPEYRSLTVYQRHEQVKREVNQYPLFNVYDVCDAVVINASPLFAYKEDPSYPINQNIRRRIVATSDGRDYTFIQYLLDRDDNLLYGYRNLGLAPDAGTYWYSPLYGTVRQWDGDAWISSVFVPTANGDTAREFVVSATEPAGLIAIEGSFWMDTTNDQLFQTNGITWTQLTNLLIQEADPTLETIWKNGEDYEYVPEYVDSERQPITVGDPNGDWELLDQWFYNSEHKNKQETTYTQLFSHFRTIITEQPDVPGFLQGGAYTLTQNEYNYSLGGTIKEHNDSFDTLISAVNTTNVTPVALMEWAEDQYVLSQLFVRDIFNTDLTTLYGTYTPQSLVDQAGMFTDTVLLEYKLNDFLATVYGDTTAYNSGTDVGMPNWVASAPIFRLSEKFRPHLNITDEFVEVFHHDSHRTRVSYTDGEQDRFSRRIIALEDTRVANGTLGILDVGAPPVTEAAYLAAFGGSEMREGVYWYRVGGGFRTLYRFTAYKVTTAAPSFFLDGEELPDGTRYYNTIANLVYVKSGLAWNVDTGFAGDISMLWEEVNFALDLAKIYLEVEERLYAAVPDTDLAFDYTTLTPDVGEQAEYDNQYERRFYAFVAEREISAPLVNTTYSATNAFTWNYVNSTYGTPPRIDITPDQAASWQEIYTRWFGTPYPHLEPWKLQGFHDKPTWWDDEYLETDGSRRWIYDHGTTTGMWENIRVGAIPVGRDLPDGSGVGTGLPGDILVTFNYFCVNIGDSTVAGYAPDEVFPPYFNITLSPDPIAIRSLFTAMSEISAPDADYLFGDGGPSEWLWTSSSEYVYDIPIIAFLMQPARFLHYTFGMNFIDVNKLQVETRFCQVYSHEDALFHGDVYNTDQIYSANGLNQWYVNFNRASGYDTSGEFRTLWAGWNPRQGYQFAGIIDTSTFDISTKYFDVVQDDYDILLANTGVFRDMWSEGFEVSVLSIPPAIVQYNNQALWRFDFDSLAAIDRTISYYGVRLYPFTIDVTTDVGTFYKYQIVDASATADRFYVPGNQTSVFSDGTTFDVINSSLNDGTYTVDSAVFEPSANRTHINVVEPVPSSIGDGQIDVSGFVSPWATGQAVVVSSSRNLPVPLVQSVPYFVINTGNKTFKLAETQADALNNIPIDITAPGDGELRLGEVTASFQVYGGAGNSPEIWYHYAIDKNNIITVTPPTTITGMQTLIDVFDGYADYQRDQGQIFNASTTAEFDAQTGRAMGWQFEIERFINWAYGLRRTRMQVADRFAYTLNAAPSTQELVFTAGAPVWQNGQAIVFSTTGSMPSPLVAGVPYYYVETSTPGVFKVSITSNTSLTSNHVTFTTTGSGTLSVAQYRAQLVFPSFEVNPTRNNIWYDTPLGLMSNVVTGPYTDIRVSQTIFDQYGRLLTPDKLNVYRLDKQTRIAIRAALNNDQSMVPTQLRTEYDYLHMGGGHFFMEGYEHIILFEDYAVGGALIYDQFLGLYTPRFNLDYFEKEEYTLRPSVGGYYLIDGQFERNIEGSTVDLHNYYDTYDLREGTLPARYARRLLGYKGEQSYLNMVNMNSKSQFLFYQGMIQYKGSVAGAKAYINSRRFIDAKIDEFWAWKIAEYGDTRMRVYPQIKLFADDATLQDVRMHFLAPTESTADVDVEDAIENDFIVVNFDEGTRWEIYPEQKAEILSPLFLDAQVSSMYRVFVSGSAPTSGQTTVDYWYDTGTQEFKSWDGTVWTVVTDPPLEFNIGGSTTYVRLSPVFDEARVIRRKLTLPGDLREYETVIYNQGGGIEEFLKVNSEVISFQTVGFADVMIFFTINPGYGKISPSKLIDTKSKTVVSEVPLWDPARDFHSAYAIHNVDLSVNTDPAGYQTTLNPLDVADHAWGVQQVGTVWLDTNALGYKKYYDDKLYPNVNDRLNSWGSLADWGNVRVYEWVSSSVPPTDYADLVTEQAADLRAQRTKASGTARQTLFKRTRTPVTANIVNITSGSQTADFGLTIPNSAASTGLAVGTQGYQDVDFTTTFAGGDPTGLVGTGPFQASVFVDGDSYLISVTATSAPTYTALIAQISAQLLGSATVTAFDTDTIRIESNSIGLGSTVIIQDINLFSNLVDAPAIIQLPVSGTSTTYTATFTLDGIDYDLSVLGDDAQTFGDLITIINAQISGVGSIALVPAALGNLVVTSTSVGTTSTVLITPGTLFPALTGYVGLLAAVVGTYGQVEVVTGSFDVGDTLLFTSTDTLPSGLEASVQYTVATVTPAGPNDLLDLVDEDDVAVDISTVGVGTLSAVPTFTDNWVRIPFIRERQYGGITIVPASFEPVLQLDATVGWAEDDLVDVYINDVLAVGAYELTPLLQVDLVGTNITVNEKDIIDIVRPLRTLTEDEENFDPETEDDGTVMVQWRYDYEYSRFTSYTGTAETVPTQTYYFWVENSQFRDETDRLALSAQEVTQQLTTIPMPYFVVQLPKDDPFLVAKYGYGVLPYGTIWSLASLAEQFLLIPVFYRQAILRKAASSIAQDNRFVWKFTRNLALRNTLNNSLNLKNKHNEWFMFRREQPSSIPRELWDRLTEALVGYTLADATVRVPSLDRELYDALFGTDTRYGLGENQAFVNRDYALASIIAYLSDPNRDFQPLDIDDFFATYSFDTPENIIEAMNIIYTTFSSEHVNNIWFETLSDALATRAKYKELLKTSWVALHGIRVLEVGGLFDD